eukprot:4688048-Prymnesium_polylepis.4
MSCVVHSWVEARTYAAREWECAHVWVSDVCNARANAAEASRDGCGSALEEVHTPSCLHCASSQSSHTSRSACSVPALPRITTTGRVQLSIRRSVLRSSSST